MSENRQTVPLDMNKSIVDHAEVVLRTLHGEEPTGEQCLILGTMISSVVQEIWVSVERAMTRIEFPDECKCRVFDVLIIESWNLYIYDFFDNRLIVVAKP